jgi:hypothetical protein
MSGKATPGIDPRMAAALKNNTDHAAASNMQHQTILRRITRENLTML